MSKRALSATHQKNPTDADLQTAPLRFFPVSCQKTSLLLDTLVSSLEITSSPSFTIQILGLTPMIILDSCDSGQIYLSQQGVERSELVVSKCSAINVSVPKEGGEEGDFTEVALPEQIKFAFGGAGAGLKSEVVAHSG